MKIRLFLIALSLLLAPAHGLAAPDGAGLYETNCAACHQVGGGGIGLPLSPSKMATVSDAYIKATIRHGRVGRIMPAFPELSDAQVDAITAYIRSWSGVAGPTYPDTPIAGNPERGQRLYRIHCRDCHSDDGSGKGLGTGVTFSRERSYAVMPPSISNPGFLASASDQMIKQVIMFGRPGTAMQSFLDIGLREQDINDVVSYVRSFETSQRAGSAADSAAVEREPALFFDSPYDFATTVENVKQAIQGMNFTYLPDRFLEHGLTAADGVNRRQMTIRYCNFKQLYEMVRIDPRLGVGLPCRITVLENEDGSVQLVAMNMRLIAELFNNDQLIEMGEKFNQIQNEIIEEATL